MSNRRPTVDGLDDVDDEDGVVEDEALQETDLTLTLGPADEAIIGDDGRVAEEEA